MAKSPVILVVEDDPASFNALSVLLVHYEYQVKVAKTVKDALAMLAALEPEIILLDLMLPDGNGLPVLKEVKQRGMSSRVLVVTGASDARLLEQVDRLSPEAVIHKPLDFLALLSRLRRPMGERVERFSVIIRELR